MIGPGRALQASGAGAPPPEAAVVSAMVAPISFHTQYAFRLRAQGKFCKILKSYSQANEVVEGRKSRVDGQLTRLRQGYGGRVVESHRGGCGSGTMGSGLFFLWSNQRQGEKVHPTPRRVYPSPLPDCCLCVHYSLRDVTM